MSERTVTLTKNQDGTYRAERDGRAVTVRPGQVMGDEVIDRKRATYDALEALEAPDDERYGALVDWKCDGYDKLVREAGRNPPEKLLRKRDHWHAERQKRGR